MTNPFAEFPPLMRIQDVMDATQYARSTTYLLLREAEKTPGIVHRVGERAVRIHRDNFFKWFMARTGMTPLDLEEGA